MHPLLARNRLGLYLLGWLPLAAILVLLMSTGGALSWLESSVIAIPLCVVYAFICLSAWYTAKSAPIRRESALRLIGVHSLAAALVSYFWMGIGWVLVASLSKTSAFHGLDRRFSPQAPILFGAGYLLYSLSVASQYVILSLEASREAEARVIKARVLARDSELKALKAQVNPHFLFNSLNSISALTSIDAGRAREMCILLADFLRKTLGLGEKTVIPLREELELVRSFLSVEKVRFGVRLTVEESVESGALDCAVPPLLLQPLVENAVAHGISNLTEGGWIRVGVSCDGNKIGAVGSDLPTDGLRIEVENNFDPDIPRHRGHGVGLVNVRQRLATRYGDRARFEVRAEGDRFQVSIVLPAEKAETVA